MLRNSSNGKSSVLEAISRVRFPSKGTLCTRIASELALRRAPTSSFSVRIEPDATRPREQREQVSEFTAGDPSDDLAKFPCVLEAATAYLRQVDHERDRPRDFYADRLIITIRGPELPPLTIVDLPGLIRSTNDNQDAGAIDVVDQLVLSYMNKRNIIILAVVAANYDAANQGVLKLAKQADPGRKRTLGIITKPDLTPAGYDLERAAVSLAENTDIMLSLGWHVLKNCDSERPSASPDERDELELKFFSSALRAKWKTLPPNSLGVSALRKKLGDILFSCICKPTRPCEKR
jgi:hypothetical protein